MKKSRRIVCIILSILIIIGIIVIVSLIAIPEFVNTVYNIIAAIPVALENVKNFVTDNIYKYEVIRKRLGTLQIDIDGISRNFLF